MQETEFIWLNGKFVKWEDAKIHLLSHALHYGSSVFEGIRCYKTAKGPAIFRLSDHVKRFFSSFSVFGGEMPYSQEQVEKAICETIKVNKMQEAYIRPITFYGYGAMGLSNFDKCAINMAIAVWPWPKYLGEKAISVKISKFIRLHPQSVPMEAKIGGYYVNSMLATIDAKKDGFDEALLLDYKNNIAEGPGENIFIVNHGVIYTPKIGTILPGITRDSIIKIASDFGYPVKEQTLTTEDIFEAQEVMMTGTAAEVTAIGKVNDKKIGNGKEGRITARLRQAYSAIVHGKSEKYASWLTYVR